MKHGGSAAIDLDLLEVAGHDRVVDGLVIGDANAPSLDALLARSGRLLGAARRTGGALLVAAFELTRLPDDGPPPERVTTAVLGALLGELRFDDPVAQVGPALFVVAVPLVPGTTCGRGVTDHLADAITDALGAVVGSAGLSDFVVREDHAVAMPPHTEEADELVLRVVEGARAR